MATTEKFLLGSQTTLLDTGLNSLANNGLAISATYNNTQGGGAGDGYTLCDLELVCNYGTAPSVNTACSVWFLATQDGTNFEDGSATVTPARAADVVIPVRAVTGAQRIIRRAWVPWGNFQALLKNDGTGQAMAATGNTLKIRPVTVQAV